MPDPQSHADIPVLAAKHIWRHRKRYTRWRAATALRRGATPRAVLAESAAFPGLAICLIALGERFQGYARVLIESLRRAGAYDGPIYVVTDTPARFTGLPGVQPIAVAATRHQLVVKMCKTFLCDWVTHRLLLYLDADIVVGQPIAGWFKTAIARLGDDGAQFYPDPGARRLPFHGGLILMQRQRSQPLMRHWRAVLRSGRFRQDQEALLTIAQAHRVGYLPENGLMFPSEQAIVNGETACFIHITDYRYRHLGDALLRYYLRDVLGVTAFAERLGHAADS